MPTNIPFVLVFQPHDLIGQPTRGLDGTPTWAVTGDSGAGTLTAASDGMSASYVPPAGFQGTLVFTVTAASNGLSVGKPIAVIIGSEAMCDAVGPAAPLASGAQLTLVPPRAAMAVARESV